MTVFGFSLKSGHFRGKSRHFENSRKREKAGAKLPAILSLKHFWVQILRYLFEVRRRYIEESRAFGIWESSSMLMY